MTTRLTRRERRANGERFTSDVSRSRTSSLRTAPPLRPLRRGKHHPRHARTESKPKMGVSARSAVQLAGVATAGAGVIFAAAVPNTNFLALEEKTGPLEVITDSNTVAISVGKGVHADSPAAPTEDDPDGKMRSLTSGGPRKVAESNDTAGVFSYPVIGAEKTSPFGVRVNPLTGESGEFHEGQDFATPCGSEVKAAGAGIVKEAGWHPYGGGLRLVIDHGSGLSTTYNHLSAVDVRVGDTVPRGGIVAKSGTTGASTGCHLHFEVMINNRKVDPMKWL